MQKLNKKIFNVIIAVVMLLPLGVTAQTLTSSGNTYSPYSMYGWGELSTPGTAAQRSMGGVGVAMFSNTSVNVLNPAANGFTPQQSFLFHFGVDGGHFRNSQTKYGATESNVKTAYNSINIHDIAFQMPLAKGLGLGFSLTPYSSVGYTMHRDDMSVAGNMGSARYEYYGEGDVSEVKLGIGWAPVKKFSMGASMIYYWGNINRSYKMLPSNIITGNGEFASTTGIDTYDVSRVMAQFGLMWNPILKSNEILSFGATYNLGGNLNPDVVKYVYVDNLLQSTVREDNNGALPLKLPQQAAVGVFYQNLKIKVGLDYVYQGWGNDNLSLQENEDNGVEVGYTDTHTIKFGMQYTPRYSDVRNYLRRVAYRVGARYGDYYQTYGGEKIDQLAVTAGFGFPVQLFGNSYVDVGFEWGMRGLGERTILVDNMKTGLVKQNYFKFSIGLSLFGDNEWFVQRKYR